MRRQTGRNFTVREAPESVKALASNLAIGGGVMICLDFSTGRSRSGGREGFDSAL
jgi:hypothetical protein